MKLFELIEELSNHIEIKGHWGIGGSLMLLLNNINVEAHDIDIVSDSIGYNYLYQLLKKIGNEVHHTNNSIFVSNLFSRFIVKNSYVDLICEFKIKCNKGPYNYIFDKDSITYKNIENKFIPLLALEDWYFIYHLKNDMPKKSYIEKYWVNHCRNEKLYKRNLIQLNYLGIIIE